MAKDTTEKLILRNYPLLLWLIGGIFCLIGLLILIAPQGLIPALIFLGIGLVFIVLPTRTTVVADRLQDRLIVQHRSLLQKTLREYPLRDITAVEVERLTTGSKGAQQLTLKPTFEIVLSLRSGEKVALYGNVGTGSLRDRQAKAQQLRHFLGLSETSTPGSISEPIVAQMIAPPSQEQRQGMTEGVSWKVDFVQIGGLGITRWASPELKFANQFLLLVQIPQGTSPVGEGMIPSVLLKAYRQIPRIYGFSAQDTPGLEMAQGMQTLDARLIPYFIVLTSDPIEAQKILSPWIIPSLVQWAEQNPMTQLQRIKTGEFGQLVVLFSPNGLYLAFPNPLEETQIDAMIRLGVEMVKSVTPV